MHASHVERSFSPTRQEDPELEAIRQRRMAEMARAQGGGGGGMGRGAPMTPEEQEEQEAAKQ